MFQTIEKDKNMKLTNAAPHSPTSHHHPSSLSLFLALFLPQLPLMHPLYAPTQSVREFPLERQTQIIGHRFLLAGHKGTSYSPLCSCLLPILPSLLPTSCVPSNGSLTTTTTTATIGLEPGRSSSPKHSPFHCHNKAIRTHASHDPDPEPLSSLPVPQGLGDIYETFESVTSSLC